jgi:hypothetical protein
MPTDLDRLLDLLAKSPRGELSTRLHQIHNISEDAMTTAYERGYVTMEIEPIRNVEHPPVRLFITKAGKALRKLADA